jgi:hypothetical protein
VAGVTIAFMMPLSSSMLIRQIHWPCPPLTHDYRADNPRHAVIAICPLLLVWTLKASWQHHGN